MPVSVKQLRDNQNNFIYPKIAKEGLVEPINGNDVGISAINGIQSSTVQGALNELAGNNVEIVKKASGSVISVSDSADYRLLGLKLYGKSVQDGTPTPEAPVEIESAGDSGNITVTLSDGAEQSQTLTYPTPSGLPGIPVESGGNYTDADGQQWICDEVDFGRGKYVQRVAKITLTGDLSWRPNIPWDTRSPDIFHYYTIVEEKKKTSNSKENWLISNMFIGKNDNGNSITGEECIYSNYADQAIYIFLNRSRADTADLDGFKEWVDQNQPVIYYILQNPIETDLTPEQLTAYAALTMYKPNTTVTTDSSPAAGIEVKYLTDSGVSEVLDYYASKDDLANKQDKLSGTAGQFVGFDAEGEAEAQEITAADVGAVAADGTTAMTGNFNAGGHRVINVGAPTAAGDAVRQSDLQAVSDEIDAIIAGTTPVNIPVATDVKAGVVKPGEHLSVTADGTLNAEWPDLSGYLTEIPAEYVTEDELSAKGYLTAVPAEYVTDSELTGKGYATTADVAETYAPKALKFTGTFTAAGWTSATGRFSQVINVAGLTADDEPIIDLNSTATDADTFNGQLEAFGLVSNFTTGAGTLTAVVLGDSAPTVDIPIHGVVVY